MQTDQRQKIPILQNQVVCSLRATCPWRESNTFAEQFWKEQQSVEP